MKCFYYRAGGLALVVMAAIPAMADADNSNKSQTLSFGQYRDERLASFSRHFFGIDKPISKSSTLSISATAARQNPARLVTLAKGLQATVVSAEANLAPNIDQMILWPATQPTHIIACNEQDADAPGIQRISLADGQVETILTGTTECDPVRATPWGTVIVAEEAGTAGAVLEIIDPLNTTGVSYDQTAQTLSGADADNVAVRLAPGRLSFEGMALYPNGVMYFGDENRPGKGLPGGAYFKFIPTHLWLGGAPISNLNQSPLAEGQVYGLQLGNNNVGQGSNTGLGKWIEVPNSNGANLRMAAASLKLSGFYRPEDVDIDAKALADGKVRFCGNNTGSEEANKNWGETICITDGKLDEAASNAGVPEVQFLAIGTSEFAMMDNIAYQPQRGNWVILEDGDAPGFSVNPHNNDIWSCLDDGSDDDSLSDGCLRIGTLNDLTAEPTGGFFDAAGKDFYFSVQHNITGHGVILKVTGWKTTGWK